MFYVFHHDPLSYENRLSVFYSELPMFPQHEVAYGLCCLKLPCATFLPTAVASHSPGPWTFLSVNGDSSCRQYNALSSPNPLGNHHLPQISPVKIAILGYINMLICKDSNFGGIAFAPFPKTPIRSHKTVTDCMIFFLECSPHLQWPKHPKHGN